MTKLTLEIELLSAACPGAGEGWGGIIDTDVVYDEMGLPYIPGRRVRGILLELAKEMVHILGNVSPDQPKLTNQTVESLFGVQGLSDAAPLLIENAYLNDYVKVREWLAWTKNRFADLALVSPDRVLSAFTSLRQQTAIDEHGVAEENSLRTTRVLNRDSKFYARVTLLDDDEACQDLLALAVALFRSFGSKRNRGLGRIQCRLLAENGDDITHSTVQKYQKRLQEA